MAELLSERPANSEMFRHPTTGAVYYEIEGYVADCVTQLAEPAPLPESPSTSMLAAPVVELLTDTETSRDRIWYVLDLLRYHYALPSSELKESMAMNESQASRNFVSNILHSSHHDAIKHGDHDLAASIATVTCETLRQEIDVAGAENANVLLVAALQESAGAKIAEQLRQPEIDRDVPGFIYENADVRGVLGDLLLADRINLFDKDTVRFLLASYGLDPDAMMNAWDIGYRNHYPEIPVSRALKENLPYIVQLEKYYPGLTRRLFEDRKIRCFTRLSPEVLLYLDEPKSADTPRATMFVASYDHNNAFFRPDEIDQLLEQVRLAGHELEYYECATREELRTCEEKARVLQILHVLREGHSNGYFFALGDRRRKSIEANYDVKNMVDESDWIKQFHKNIRSVAIFGCKSGINGGLQKTYTGIVREGLPVSALGYSGYVSIEYSGEAGFLLLDKIENYRISKWNPLHRLAWFGKNLLIPLVVEHSRLSDEEEKQIMDQAKMTIYTYMNL